MTIKKLIKLFIIKAIVSRLKYLVISEIFLSVILLTINLQYVKMNIENKI